MFINMEYVDTLVTGFIILLTITIAGTFFSTLLIHRTSSANEKFASYYFIGFLMSVLFGYSAEAAVHLGFRSAGIFFSAVFFQAATYLLMFSICCRYDKRPSLQGYLVALTHILVIAIVRLILQFQLNMLLVTSLVSIVSCALPLLYTLYFLFPHKKLSSNHGDSILFYSLASVIGFLLVILPIYYLSMESNAETEVRLQFVSIVALESFLFTGLAVSLITDLINKLRDQVVTDKLTGAKNRNYFYEFSEKIISLSQRSGCSSTFLMFDIDDFKQLNDTYGHVVGDLALVEFVAAISKELRTQDVLVRMGGEEFIILLPNISGNEAYQAAQRLLLAVRAIEIYSDKGAVGITASVGVSELQSTLSVDENVRLADDAMYRAKKSGKNKVVYEDQEFI
jgi:diguanylate cyclase (GGDEF)-like protein